MKYSKIVTETHLLCCRYNDCLQLVCDCLKAEGGTGSLFSDKETCLNLDKIEQQQHKSRPQATMDMTIGLSTNQKKGQMLLVELRFNYKNPKNIGKQEIIDKIIHSKDLLIDSHIYPDYIFIFKNNLCNQARNHFFRLFNGKKTTCLIMTEEEFHQLFFTNL